MVGKKAAAIEKLPCLGGKLMDKWKRKLTHTYICPTEEHGGTYLHVMYKNKNERDKPAVIVSMVGG